MDALNILDAVRDPIAYSQKIGTAQEGKELTLMICINTNSGKSRQPIVRGTHVALTSPLPVLLSSMLTWYIIISCVLIPLLLLVTSQEALKFFWWFLQLYIFHDVLNSVGLFYQAQALHESFNVDQSPPGQEEWRLAGSQSKRKIVAK